MATFDFYPKKPNGMMPEVDLVVKGPLVDDEKNVVIRLTPKMVIGDVDANVRILIRQIEEAGQRAKTAMKKAKEEYRRK